MVIVLMVNHHGPLHLRKFTPLVKLGDLEPVYYWFTNTSEFTLAEAVTDM